MSQESGEARTGVSGSALRGSIINMSSVNAVLTIPTIASYNVSKGGINQLTRHGVGARRQGHSR